MRKQSLGSPAPTGAAAASGSGDERVDSRSVASEVDKTVRLLRSFRGASHDERVDCLERLDGQLAELSKACGDGASTAVPRVPVGDGDTTAPGRPR